MAELNHVTIYTDGACLGNPGPGGFGAVLLHGSQSKMPHPDPDRGLRHLSERQEVSGGFRRTTNNRMELMAAIAALEALKEPRQVSLYSDSQYLVNAMSRGWAQRWRVNGWKRNKRERAVNPDLWARLLDLCQYHTVEFLWVRGHSGARENERADRLAAAGASQPDLPIDEGYVVNG